MRIVSLATIILLVSFCSAVGAAVIHVPADQPTIQAGIDAAVSGDEVVVAEGTYRGLGNRDLDFGGKEITLRSESTPQRCIIDCEQDGRGFIFSSGEGPNTVVSGFSIVNGSSPSWHGGGMFISGTSPTIHNCIIAFCTVGINRQGGGIWCFQASPLIDRCTIYGNTSRAGGAGAGIACTNSSATITGCAIVGNKAESSSGGLFCLAGSQTISNCLFQGNVAGNQGGAVYTTGSSTDTFTNCLFIENEATNSHGGAILCNQSAPAFYNCTFSGNSAGAEGGALAIEGSSAEPVVQNSILWGDIPNEIDNNLGNPLLSYCDVEGGYYGTEIIDADPLFVSSEAGDYLLSQIYAGQAADSPCIDTGNTTATLVCYDAPTGTVCLDQLTTRTDGVGDTFQVNMGFHYGDLDPRYPPPQEWTWALCGELDGALRVYSIDDTPEGRLYAGTGPTGNVYYSDNGGASWANTGQLEDAVHVFDLHPASDGKLYAAAATTDAAVVFVSSNGGFSWSPTNELIGAETVFCLLELPGPEMLAGTGPNGDIFATFDGNNWTALGDLAGAEWLNALISASDGALYAGTSPAGDVFRSTNGGVSWAAGGELAGAEDVYSLVELPNGAIIAGTSPNGDLFRSTDLGMTWEPLPDLPGAGVVAALAMHLDGRVYAATTPHGDVFCSDDLGETWRGTSDLYGVTQVLSLHSAYDGHFYCGTAFNGDIYKSSGPVTIDCELDIWSDWGVLPFQDRIDVDMFNLTGFSRIVSGRIDVSLANGVSYSNWRSGYSIMAPGETFRTDWLQTFPALGALVGDNIFTLKTADVTPLPYNAPPYPASGFTATSSDTVTCLWPPGN